MIKIHEVYATPEDAQKKSRKDGRALMSIDGDYLIVDSYSKVVVHTGLIAARILRRLAIM